MKLTLLPLLFLFPFLITVHTQPLPLETGSWSTFVKVSGGPDEQFTRLYQTAGDTLINDLTYLQLYTNELSEDEAFRTVTGTEANVYAGAIRQDESGVFYLASNETNERALYDYTASVGDTIDRAANYPSLNSIDDPSFVIVLSSIDTVMVSNEPRRGFRYSIPNSSENSYQVIEGVGSTLGFLNDREGFLAAIAAVDPVVISELLCFSVSGATEYTGPSYVGNCLRADILDNTFSPELSASIGVFPNPASGEINISGLDKVPGRGTWTIEIINVDGKKILVSSIGSASPNHRLNLRTLPAGSYLFRFTKGDSFGIRKLVIR